MDGYEPVLASGNFAVVFKMLQNGKKHALKCFTKESAGRAERQKMIVEYIKQNPSEHFVEYHYLENELWIAEGDGMEVPVTWMEWVEAPTLGEKIKDYCESKDTDGLQLLVESFREFALWILQQPFAHGDLKHDNLLVKEDGKLVMVDYDGMFIPAFDGLLANELGSKGYQHPKRTANYFNDNLDDFSIVVIYISLLALVENPELYHQYNNGQNIIFDSIDFINPAKSTLITNLIHSINPGVKVSELSQICKNQCQSIININKLIDRPFTRQEYLLELEETKKTILSHFERLSINNQLGKNLLRSTEEMLDSQIIITKQLFENLQEKLPLKSFSEETGLEKWWNNLSEEWKELLFMNIQFSKESTIPNFEVIDLFSWEIQFDYKYKKFNGEDINEILQGVKNLTQFICVDKEFDLAPIARLKNLTAVFLQFQTDITVLSTHPQLVSLYLFSNKADLDPLKSLINLKELEIDNCNFNLSPISNLTNLKELRLNSNSADLNPLSSLIQLTELQLRNNKLDLNPIKSLKNLRILDLSHNTANLKPITSLINLTNLNLYNNLAELGPLSSLANLTYLNLEFDKSNLYVMNVFDNLNNLAFLNGIDIQPIKQLITHINGKGGKVVGIDLNEFKERLDDIEEEDLPF